MLRQFITRLARVRAARFTGQGRSFCSDKRGATMVEFALVAFPFFGLLFAIFESAFLIFNQGNLEQATFDASRKLLTRSIQTATGATNTSMTAAFKTAVCAGLWANFDCSKVQFDVRNGADFANNTYNTSSDFYGNAALTTFAPGGAGSVIVVRVAYPYPLYFGPLSGLGAGTRTMMATAVFKAEN
jgi:Flp pilus assembly protein TadG